MRALLLAAILSITGCSALTHPAEIAWQTVHAVDSAQTWSIVDSPCFKEGGPVTRALIGSDPSHAQVAAWAVGAGVVHAAVSSWLLDHEWSRAFKVWEAVTITSAGLTVASNHHLGVRIGSANDDCR